MTERILIASDLHLSQRIWQHRPIFGDSYSSWRQLVTLAIDYEVTAVILAGDLLDRQSNVSEPVCEFAAGLNRLISAGIAVYYVQGQHEMQETPWASLVRGVLHINDKLVDIAGLKVYGMDFRSATQLQESLRRIPAEANVLVAHQVWADFMGDIVHSQGSFADIPGNIEVLITGDYHKTVLHQLPSGLHVLSPGSTHMRAINEPAKKCGCLLTIQDDGHLHWELLELRTRPVFVWDLRAGVDEPAMLFARCREELIAALSDASREEPIRKPLVRVLYTDAQENLVRQLKDMFSQMGHLFFAVSTLEGQQCQADMSQRWESAQISMQDFLGGYVQQAIVPGNRGLVEDLASRLLSSSDPKSSLDAWIAEKEKAKDV